MRWEYKVHTFESKSFLPGKFKWEEFQDELNRLGRDGWELVNTFDTNGFHGMSAAVVTLFKRSMG